MIGPIEPQQTIAKNTELLSLAQKLESQFLAEMLKISGVAKPPESFGGGTGESQFSSFLVHEYADAVTAKGGIGLSEVIYNALVQKGSET